MMLKRCTPLEPQIEATSKENRQNKRQQPNDTYLKEQPMLE